jgi:integrase
MIAKADLSSRQLPSLGEGRHRVRSGLYLRVQGSRRSWVARYEIDGKRRWVTLGDFRDMTLARANRVRSDKTPSTDSLKAKKANIGTFREWAARYMDEVKQPTWRGPKSRSMWEGTLANYAYPTIGTTQIDKVTTEDLLRILSPIWLTKNETANRTRGRIEAVIGFALAVSHTEQLNPASLDRLKYLLPKTRKTVQHLPAAPWETLPGIYAQFKSAPSLSKQLFMFQCLTASRPGEARQIRWSDIKDDIWTVDTSTQKIPQYQEIPLSRQALAIIENQKKRGEFVFMKQDGGILSNNALGVMLKKAGMQGHHTAHGSRSAFRDWGSAQGYPADLLERQLSHLPSKVERAYQRNPLTAQRRPIVQAWADHLDRDRE